MIDAHVHLRDWEQADAETLEHGLSVAERAGLDAVFEMPNTKPLIIDRKTAEKRIADADSCSMQIFHGLYLGLTADPDQIREAVITYHDLFPRVVGFKLFAGRSTGNLSVIAEDKQKAVIRHLAHMDFSGVLAVHAEKESHFQPDRWDPRHPASHNDARPPQAEAASIQDIMSFAASSGYQGHLHIAHISAPESVDLLQIYREHHDFTVSCAVTPHHFLLNTDLMTGENALHMKVNPPIRCRQSADKMLEYLKMGLIDFIESDHAPHTQHVKNIGLASGIPGLPIWPHVPGILQSFGFENTHIQQITHTNIEKIFRIKIPATQKQGDMDLFSEYPVNAYSDLRRNTPVDPA